jgi:hypothetical protein
MNVMVNFDQLNNLFLPDMNLPADIASFQQCLLLVFRHMIFQYNSNIVENVYV